MHNNINITKHVLYAYLFMHLQNRLHNLRADCKNNGSLEISINYPQHDKILTKFMLTAYSLNYS